MDIIFMTAKFCRFYGCSIMDVWKMPYVTFFAYFNEMNKIIQSEKQ